MLSGDFDNGAPLPASDSTIDSGGLFCALGVSTQVQIKVPCFAFPAPEIP